MSVRPIIHIPDPLLRQASKPVERVDAEMRRLLDDMLETMYAAPGIGLAAVQVGIPLRLITIDIAKRVRRDALREAEARDGVEASAGEPDDAQAEEVEVREPIFLVNPKIIRLGDERSTYEEGCLSIPDYYADVERPASCTVSYLDRDGAEQVLEADGILSTCLQHEIDHLDGKLFIDHISRLKREMVVKKFTKIAKQNGKPAGKASARMVG